MMLIQRGDRGRGTVTFDGEVIRPRVGAAGLDTAADRCLELVSDSQKQEDSTMRFDLSRAFVSVAALMAFLGAPALAQSFTSATVLAPRGPDGVAAFGREVVLDGDTLAVSSPSFTSEGGVVYLYQRDLFDQNDWSLVKRINPPCDARSIALDGDTLVIGGCRWCGELSQLASVYVYDRNRLGKDRWGLLQRIRADYPEPTRNEFGFAVAVDGASLAISDPQNDTVRTYERGSHGWTEIARLSRDTAFNGSFGAALELSGKTLVVGAANHCYGPSTGDFRSDGVFTFERDSRASSGWRETRHLKNTERESLAGELLSLEGPTLAMSGNSGLEIHERDHRGRKRWGQRQAPAQFFRSFAVRGRTLAMVDTVEDGFEILVHDRVGAGRVPWIPTEEILEVDLGNTLRATDAAVGRREVVVGYGRKNWFEDVPKRVVIYHRSPIHADSFESGDLGTWEAPKRKVGVARPGLGGSDFALEVFADGKAKKSFVRTRSPKREPMVSLDFLLNANAVDLGGQQVEILRLSGGGKTNAAVTLRDRGSRYVLHLQARQNSGPLLALGELEIPIRADVRIRLEWQRATGDGHANGVARLTRVGGASVGSSLLSTDRLSISDLKLGLPAGAKGTAGGSFLIDDVTLHQ